MEQLVQGDVPLAPDAYCWDISEPKRIDLAVEHADAFAVANNFLVRQPHLLVELVVSVAQISHLACCAASAGGRQRFHGVMRVACLCLRIVSEALLCSHRATRGGQLPHPLCL